MGAVSAPVCLQNGGVGGAAARSVGDGGAAGVRAGRPRLVAALAAAAAAGSGLPTVPVADRLRRPDPGPGARGCGHLPPLVPPDAGAAVAFFANASTTTRKTF